MPLVCIATTYEGKKQSREWRYSISTDCPYIMNFLICTAAVQHKPPVLGSAGPIPRLIVSCFSVLLTSFYLLDWLWVSLTGCNISYRKRRKTLRTTIGSAWISVHLSGCDSQFPCIEIDCLLWFSAGLHYTVATIFKQQTAAQSFHWLTLLLCVSYWVPVVPSYIKCHILKCTGLYA